MTLNIKTLAADIERTVVDNATLIGKISDADFEFKPSPKKWSKKEILGHLVDSAQNNIQRLVRGQYEDTPKIIYEQDTWVNLQQYHGYNRNDLTQLWVLLNKHLCRILTVMDPANYEKTCDVSQPGPAVRTLKFLAEDYLVHMKHHLAQINAAIP